MPFFGKSYKSTPPFIMNCTTPILLVHGYAQNQADWIWLKHKLKQKGIGPVYSLNLCPPFASMIQLAELVKNKVEEISQETKHPNIILIGHSMGGLISSYYSEFLASPGEVSAIITLGTPFQGTKLAALGFGQNVTEMIPNSQFLRELTKKIKVSSIQYHYIASKVDNLIVPWESAIPSYADGSDGSKENTFIVENRGHLSLLISSRVINQIIQWLKEIKIK